jgi:hypothetical protein
MCVVALSSVSPAAAQLARPLSLPSADVAALQRVVDAAEQQQLEGDPGIRWDVHFMKGPDGRTYVPFTVTIAAAHEAVGVYMRVVQRAPIDDNTSRALLGSLLSQGAIGLDTMRDARRTTLARSVFQDAVGIPTSKAVDGGRLFRAAVLVPPGDHDFYIAIDDRSRRSRERLLLKRPLKVPKFPQEGLCLSSVITVDRVEPLAAPLREKDRIVHPYVIGQSELMPRTGVEFRRSDTFTVAFFIYNASADDKGKPDVEVTYRLFREGFAARRGIGETTPQRLGPATLPADFDLRAGHQLAATQSLPLDPYQQGEYTLDIGVTDRRTGAHAAHQVLFRIWR